MSDIAPLEKGLNEMIVRGELMPAFEKYYAEDVTMQENSEPPVLGKAANRTREQAFVDSVGQVHGIKLVGSAVGDGVTYSEWSMDLTFKGGARAVMNQAIARRWKNGKVVSERFYYSKK